MIAVIDYGMGNLRSVQKALQRCGGRDVRLVERPQQLAGADKVVLPGVAAFGDAIAQLRRQGLAEPLLEFINAGKPLLGFCLGLQMLFETGYEDGVHQGLGVLKGKVVRFDFGSDGQARGLRVPHMGWNQIRWQRDCPMLRGIDNGAYVYFAHSYHVVTDDPDVAATTTDYGYPFVSSVWKDNIFATQFHPEKSQQVGLTLLKNFVEL